MTRKRRRIGAWVGILGLAFAHVAVTAHACLTGAAVHASAVKAVAMAHDGHCAGGSPEKAPMAPSSNACEVQCTDSAPTGASPDMPPVAFVALPVEPLPISFTLALQTWDRMSLEAASAQPRPQLQFVRFLN